MQIQNSLITHLTFLLYNDPYLHSPLIANIYTFVVNFHTRGQW